jgi:U3 small nucleolar RNA-associated protein 6
MAAASDKARFYLEQSVPELKEFERKKIFSAEEISKIARQRSDFEHKINARGSTAADYVRYAEL